MENNGLGQLFDVSDEFPAAVLDVIFYPTGRLMLNRNCPPRACQKIARDNLASSLYPPMETDLRPIIGRRGGKQNIVGGRSAVDILT